MKSHYTIKDKQTGTILKEFNLSDAANAFAFAHECEEMGLDIEILSPTITQTLAHSLGVSDQASQEMEQSIQEELEDHDFSCCVTKKPNENLN
jgi:hypothetical protein